MCFTRRRGRGRVQGPSLLSNSSGARICLVVRSCLECRAFHRVGIGDYPPCLSFSPSSLLFSPLLPFLPSFSSFHSFFLFFLFTSSLLPISPFLPFSLSSSFSFFHVSCCSVFLCSLFLFRSSFCFFLVLFFPFFPTSFDPLVGRIFKMLRLAVPRRDRRLRNTT